MNVLDENIPNSQRQLLHSWRIRIRQIGYEVSCKGVKDKAIILLLHEIAPVTFFTRDLGFYYHYLCHANYCLVCLAVSQYEIASFVRRFLKHPAFNSRAKRMGKVVRITHGGIRFWQPHAEKEEELTWST